MQLREAYEPACTLADAIIFGLSFFLMDRIFFDPINYPSIQSLKYKVLEGEDLGETETTKSIG